jgi:hypothetical protein
VPDWPERAGIILLRGEGYARHIDFDANWLAAEEVAKIHHEWITVNATPPMSIRLPDAGAPSIRPGAPVRFGESTPAYAPGVRLVPFDKRGKGTDVGAGKSQEIPESRLSAEIELPTEIEFGHDIEAVYLIGNTGRETLYIEQNELTPALVAWQVRKGAREVARFDGSAFDSLQALLPQRPVLALNPGEFLTWKRVLLADELGIARSGDYTLSLSLEAGIRRNTDGEEERVMLSAEVPLRIRK